MASYICSLQKNHSNLYLTRNMTRWNWNIILRDWKIDWISFHSSGYRFHLWAFHSKFKSTRSSWSPWQVLFEFCFKKKPEPNAHLEKEKGMYSTKTPLNWLLKKRGKSIQLWLNLGCRWWCEREILAENTILKTPPLWWSTLLQNTWNS